MPTADDLSEAADDDPQKVENWRLHILVEAGYRPSLAEKIARSDADLHRAVGLVAAGCPPKLAARIIL